ncbi:MAG: pantoate--beta-alanine ligase [Candidatus Eisenbacteria bacterium]|uniref:Pantothenate synthetase n=1 Tax=Eiseniibacteriota bacterium TaxID=2212470 RepID=A0A849SGK3_UNCEI|nr:pantoate--beta-alanine ligase [Candidatus Eisenbacteria bacterium]
MRMVRESSTVRLAIAAWRRAGDRIAFVPTMGAIHAGHLSLVARARRSADRVVASIFVNPLQFGPREDYRRYPRPLVRDRAQLEEAAVDLLWTPEVDDLYPSGHRTRVRVTGLTDGLEGAARPGHFDGVCTVVAKLLLIVQPDVLWLGQKDAQQARVIEQMVADLDLAVMVRRGETTREPDGLALSSRNAYLSVTERRQALALSRGLREARRRLAGGERSALRIQNAVRKLWRDFPLVREDYVAVVDASTLEPVTRVSGRVLVAVAARVGATRLIDNFEWEPR